MTDLHEALRDDVRMLGASLGETIKSDLGEGFLDKIELVRQLAKKAGPMNSRSMSNCSRLCGN